MNPVYARARERRQRIAADRARGLTLAQIAVKEGVSRNRVWQLLRVSQTHEGERRYLLPMPG